MRRIYEFLGINPTWESPLLHQVISSSDDKTPPPPDAVAEIADYYEPFDARLRARLGLTSLPWSRV